MKWLDTQSKTYSLPDPLKHKVSHRNCGTEAAYNLGQQRAQPQDTELQDIWLPQCSLSRLMLHGLDFLSLCCPSCTQSPWCGVVHIGRCPRLGWMWSPHAVGWWAEAQQSARKDGLWLCGSPTAKKISLHRNIFALLDANLSCGCEALRAGGSLVLCWDPWGSRQAQAQRTGTIGSLC